MHSGSPSTLSFSGHALDLQRCALMRGDQELQLRPRSFDVLRYLAEHRGRLVSKEELLKACWPDTFVTDDSLVQCIKISARSLSTAIIRSSRRCRAVAICSRPKCPSQAGIL